MDEISVGLLFYSFWLVISIAVGVLILQVGRIPLFRQAIRPAISVASAVILALVCMRWLWPVGDIYGWGLYAIPVCTTGALLPFIWVRGGYRFSLVLVVVLQLALGSVAIGNYINTMDDLGYTISYQHFQILHGNGAGIDRALQGFDSEINATTIYIVEGLLLQLMPFLFLPVIRFLPKTLQLKFVRAGK